MIFVKVRHLKVIQITWKTICVNNYAGFTEKKITLISCNLPKTLDKNMNGILYV